MLRIPGIDTKILVIRAAKSFDEVFGELNEVAYYQNEYERLPSKIERKCTFEGCRCTYYCSDFDECNLHVKIPIVRSDNRNLLPSLVVREIKDAKGRRWEA